MRDAAMVSNEDDQWDEAFDALNPYHGRPDVAPLVAMLTRDKPVPADIARDLAKLLNGLTARVLGYGLVVQKFPKHGPKQVEKWSHEEQIYCGLLIEFERYKKLEAAIAAVKQQTGLSRAKLMQVWSRRRWAEKVDKEIRETGRSPTYEAKRKAESKTFKKNRRPSSSC
jgi:hypothetical protein